MRALPFSILNSAGAVSASLSLFPPYLCASGVDPYPLSPLGHVFSAPISFCAVLGLGSGFHIGNRPFTEENGSALSKFPLAFSSQPGNDIFCQEISCSLAHLRLALGTGQLFEQRCVLTKSLSRLSSPALCEGGESLLILPAISGQRGFQRFWWRCGADFGLKDSQAQGRAQHQAVQMMGSNACTFLGVQSLPILKEEQLFHGC